jgi:hypothetical protein
MRAALVVPLAPERDAAGGGPAPVQERAGSSPIFVNVTKGTFLSRH